MNSLLLLFLSLNSSASLDCAKVDLNQLSDDKISEYTHCFKDAEVSIADAVKNSDKIEYTPVCDRSEPVKLRLEDIFNNPCEQITKDMLDAYNGTFEMSGEEYQKPKAGDLSGMNNLKFLYLHNNNIEILPTGIFDDLENLRLINLSNNKIEEVSVNIFNKLLKLRRLELAHNNIKVLSHPIFSTPVNSLVSLYLYENPLTHIYNPAFKNLSKLNFLDLGSTNLTIIGKSVFTPLENLQELDLTGIEINNNMISEQINEPTISLDDLSIQQFTHLQPFPLIRVGIYYSESLIRNKKLINQLKEKGVYVVD